MAALFPFELVSPDRLLFSGQVEAVVLPAAEGEMTVMAGHAPMIVALRPGVVLVEENKSKNGVEQLFVRGGFADIRPDGLTLLADVAVPMSEFKQDFFDHQIRQAEEAYHSATTDDAKRLAAEKLSQLREVRTLVKH